MKMSPEASKWFMSHNGETRDGVTLTVRQDYKKKAYFGEFKFGQSSIQMRWDMDCHAGAQHERKYDDRQDVEDVVNEGFAYCIALKKMLQSN